MTVSDKPSYRTLGSTLSSAELCRRNGWGVGCCLQSARDEQTLRRIKIVITAVGDGLVLARQWTNANNDQNDSWWADEKCWNLTHRDWSVWMNQKEKS